MSAASYTPLNPRLIKHKSVKMSRSFAQEFVPAVQVQRVISEEERTSHVEEKNWVHKDQRCHASCDSFLIKLVVINVECDVCSPSPAPLVLTCFLLIVLTSCEVLHVGSSNAPRCQLFRLFNLTAPRQKCSFISPTEMICL